MRRLMHTTMALPFNTSSLCSKWATMSAATSYQPFLGTDYGLQLSPFGLESFLAFHFFAFGYFLELWVD